MDIRLKMREGFRDLQGGLFGKVEKADVGGAAEEVQRAGGDMLGWARPLHAGRLHARGGQGHRDRPH